MADWYVDLDSGNNGNAGTSWGAAWLTISFAVLNASVNGGDTIWVRGTRGTSYDPGYIFFNQSGSSGNPITLRAEDSNDPILLSMSNQWDMNDESYWTIDGFIFRDYSSGNMILMGINSSVGSTDNIIRNCQFSTVWEGIRARNTQNLLVEDCDFFDIGPHSATDDSFGILFDWESAGSIIRRCAFHDCQADAVHIAVQEVDGDWDIIVEDCSFWITRPFGGMPWNSPWTNIGENAIDIKVVTNSPWAVQIKDCYFYGFRDHVTGSPASGGSAGDAIIGQSGTQGLLIENSVFDNCNRALTLNLGTIDNITFRNNLVKNMTSDVLEATANDVGVGIWALGVDNLIVQNNTFYNIEEEILRLQDVEITGRNNFFSGPQPGTATGTFTLISMASEDWDYSAFDNIGASVPGSMVGANDETITTLNLDNSFIIPETGSDLLGEGTTIAAIPNDVYDIVRPTPRAIGSGELYVIPTNKNILDVSGKRIINREFFDDTGDSDRRINPVPIKNTWGYKTYIHGVDQNLKHTFTSTKRFRMSFYVWAKFVDVFNSYFQIIVGRAGTTQVVSIDLFYSSGWRIRARTRNDSSDTTAADQFVGSSNGFPISFDRHLIEFDVSFASSPGDNDGFMSLWIDDVFQGTVSGIDNDSRSMTNIDIGALSAGMFSGDYSYVYLDSFSANNTGQSTTGQGILTNPLHSRILEGIIFDRGITQ